MDGMWELKSSRPESFLCITEQDLPPESEKSSDCDKGERYGAWQATSYKYHYTIWWKAVSSLRRRRFKMYFSWRTGSTKPCPHHFSHLQAAWIEDQRLSCYPLPSPEMDSQSGQLRAKWLVLTANTISMTGNQPTQRQQCTWKGYYCTCM